MTYGKECDIMKELLEKLDDQNLNLGDYQTMIKVLQASLQRGAIQITECETVGKLYKKLDFMIKKETNNAGLSKTDN